MVETEGGLEFADQHVIGVAKGCDEEMIKDLNMVTQRIDPFAEQNHRC